MSKTEYKFSSKELESKLKDFSRQGITELTVHDKAISKDKARLMHFIKSVERDAPSLFVTMEVEAECLTQDIIKELCNINASIEIPFIQTDKGFDKKFYSKKCSLLNDLGLVFGSRLYFADRSQDSLKAFKDRLDFTVCQYPNHIDFPQIESSDASNDCKASGTFSGLDIRYARDLSFACRTFYSQGRAVPWFNTLIASLKITPSSFFADFAEWQRVNNCDYKSGFVPEEVSHTDIEKMQLLFISLKLEEKHLSSLYTAITDIIRINGAFSRLVSDGEESIIDTSYDPDDLLGPESMDLKSFVNDVCMNPSRVKIFLNHDGDVDYALV